MNRLSDYYDRDEFAALLSDAERNAEPLEKDFIEMLRKRFSASGTDMPLNDSQDALLVDIALRGEV